MRKILLFLLLYVVMNAKDFSYANIASTVEPINAEPGLMQTVFLESNDFKPLSFVTEPYQKFPDVFFVAASLKPDQTPASFSYTYEPAGKRDPFQSLLEGRQSKVTERKIKAKKFAQFLENIKSLQPINLHFYNKLKRKDSVLYKKLRSFSRFFKNYKAIKAISQRERVLKLEDYKKLLDIAGTNFQDTILRPLQREYSSLKLVGIIRGKIENIALLQTPDGKGRTVKRSDLVGPNYGVVEKIEKDKIIIVEQYINYIGKITKKRREIILLREGSI